MKSSNIELLICDLDNTLYDWVNYFVPSFYAMVDKAVEITGCDREKLLDDFRNVHQRHHDSEHPFSLLETETVQNLYPAFSDSERANILDDAFKAFNSTRKKKLKLHNGVRETLETISNAGVKIVAHTDSKLFGVIDRMRRLEIEAYFDRIYCRERPLSLNPNNITFKNWLGDFPIKKVVELSRHQAKPDPNVLKEICSDEGVPTTMAAYVGDSIARDVLMAKKAGSFSIWAAYGAKHDDDLYAMLVRVSHWTAAEVQREKQLTIEANQIRPDFTAESSFDEVLEPLGLVEQVLK